MIDLHGAYMSRQTRTHKKEQLASLAQESTKMILDVNKALLSGQYRTQDRKLIETNVARMVSAPFFTDTVLDQILESTEKLDDSIVVILEQRLLANYIKESLLNLASNHADKDSIPSDNFAQIVKIHAGLSARYKNFPTLVEILSETYMTKDFKEVPVIEALVQSQNKFLFSKIIELTKHARDENFKWLSSFNLDTFDWPIKIVPEESSLLHASEMVDSTMTSSARNSTSPASSRLGHSPRLSSASIRNNADVFLAAMNNQNPNHGRYALLRNQQVTASNQAPLATDASTITSKTKRKYMPGDLKLLEQAIRENRHEYMIELLKSIPINKLNLPNKHGKTIFYMALEMNNTTAINAIVDTFLEEKAAINVLGPDNKSIFEAMTNEINSDTLSKRLLDAVLRDYRTYQCGDALTFSSMIPDSADKQEILARKPLNDKYLQANSIQPIKGGRFTRGQIESAAKSVDESKAAVCTTFALSAANRLLILFPNERVEIVAHNHNRESHVYVLMNRAGNKFDGLNLDLKDGDEERILIDLDEIINTAKGEMKKGFVVDPWLLSLGHSSASYGIEDYMASELTQFLLQRECRFDSKANKPEVRHKPR